MMIRVRRKGVTRPRSLLGKKAIGPVETQEAIKFFGKRKNKTQKFNFSAYKQADIKEALEKLFNKKCAYCETRYSAACPGDVEHYRPKGSVRSGSKSIKPGYYWLAADWDNLLLSCVHCNRRMRHQLHDGTRALVGKGDHFPIKNLGKRARKPKKEKHESRLLLDPCRDNPDAHLVFTEDGIVLPRKDRRGRVSSMGKNSIEVYGLLRQDLVFERKKIIKVLKSRIAKIAKLEKWSQKYPGDREIKETLADEIQELSEFAESDRPYSGMVRQFLSKI